MLSTLLLLLINFSAMAQIEDFAEDDLQLERGNIFSDFNEDLESAKVLEDERFYRYGRYFTVDATLGTTFFTGNRGSAYNNNPPSFGLGVSYFLNFQTAFTLGFASSKHDMIFNTKVDVGGPATDLGLVSVRMFRVYSGIKYYIDTTNLGTALTYGNPHLIFRFEYWYHTNKFEDRDDVPQESFGAFGTAVGAGLEFPIEIKESYIAAQLLYHAVGFEDKYTQDFRPLADSTTGVVNEGGIESLTGNPITFMVSYIISW